ncbi:flagellar filament capping protein FliD [Shewanella sp. NIFS-20-20]|uniref:flagellar filament capping protein FliD n=1 Tax=Shewanella sp. NIFS-20-20 TaxID=2853806 RepID=UPI001C4511FE|nr:flagellar filament capping protein FliD [Shewanella sp. NIFS-20-20]MBV7314785.1 flagellar filament capping protein FliD [Shewanella sp. NIFS-20-20]
MALTATGIGSGLDINNIVKVLVDAEKLPKEASFNKTEDDIKAKVSAIGKLKSALSSFQDALAILQDGKNLNQRQVSTGDNPYFTATADKFAQSGTYSIKVEQLASAHKVGGAFTTAPTSTVGEGSLDFDVAGKQFSVDILATDDLTAIASKINSASDNAGVTASVVNTNGGSRLVFSSNETGLANAMTVSGTDAVGGGTGLADMFNGANQTELQPGLDAIVYIDNQRLDSASNTIDGAITGVSIELTEADVDKTSTLSISLDKTAVKDSVQGFVDSYNSLMTEINKLSAYDADKKTAAALQGDSMVRSIESQLRSMVSNRVDVEGESIALYDIGISIDRYGKMSVDSAKLDESIATNMGGIEGLFATEDTGLANQLDSMVENYVKAGGLIDSRKNSYTSQQQRLEDQKEAFARKMEQLQARLTKQFNAMDLVVGQLNAQGAGILDRLNSLPGVIKS